MLRLARSWLCFRPVIRFFVYGLPALILAAIVASYVNVALLSASKKNEMSIGMLGEPSTLNPIRQADASASQVNSGIFNGLLKYDENLEIAPDLAESFTLSQTTTIFFTDENAALSALLALEASRDKWKSWNLTSVRISGNSLLLKLSEPGMDTSRTILTTLDQKSVLPLRNIRVNLEKEAPAILSELKTSPLKDQIIRSWVESSGAFELTVTGDSTAFLDSLKAFLAERKDIKSEASLLDEIHFLAEPEVLFKLRTDVRWHDGAPFTSKDAVFTYNAIMNEAVASPRKPDFDTILHVEAPSPSQFRVTYRKPYSPALNSWMMSLLPAHILEGKSVDWWTENFDRKPIGTGPFMFDQWRTNEFIRVVRNPDYFHKPSPWLDAVVYRALGDQLAMRLAFETKQVDFWSVDPWAVKGFEGDRRFMLFSQPGNMYTYVGWNLRRPLFQDERVRRALAHAVNVPEMVKYIIYGHGEQSTGIFAPQMWFFNPNIKPLDYDPEKAKALLAEAGWVPGPDGILQKDGKRFSFKLISNNGNEIRRDIATLVQDDLKSIGIEVKIELYEWAVFLKNFVNKGDFDAMVLGWSLGLDFDQYQIWHSSQNNPEQLNVVSYNNPKVDQLLHEVRQEYNRDTIIRMAGEMQSIIYQDQPYLFLYVPESTSIMWNDSYRIRRPGPDGTWVDTPVEMTKAGWSYYMDWFYRPEYSDLLPKEAAPKP